MAHWALPKKRSWPRISGESGRELRGVELAEEVQARGRREVEQVLDLRHEVDLAAALQGIDPLGRSRDLVAVEVGGPLLELGEVLDRSSAPVASRTAAGCSRRAGSCVSMRRRCDCGRMSPTRWVAADVWPLTWQSKQATPCMPSGALGLAVGRGVELLLRELRDQEPHALQVLGVEDPREDLLEVLDRHHLPLRDVAQVGPRGQVDRRRELGEEVLGRSKSRSNRSSLGRSLISICGKTMPPTSCLGWGSGRKPLGNRPFSRISSGDIAASVSQVIPRGSFAAGPTWTGLPRDILTVASGFAVRSYRDSSSSFCRAATAGLIGLVLGHPIPEGLLAQQDRGDLVVARLGGRAARLLGRCDRPGLQDGNGCQDGRGGRSRQQAEESSFAG